RAVHDLLQHRDAVHCRIPERRPLYVFRHWRRRRRDVFREGVKLELDEERAKPFAVRIRDAQSLELEWHLDVVADRDEPLRQAREIGVLEERFARTLLWNLLRMREDVLERAERVHELLRRLLADAPHA